MRKSVSISAILVFALFFPGIVFSQGIVAHYPFDCSAIDIGCNGYNGTDSNVTYGAGLFGQAGYFNGTDSYIDVSGLTFPPNPNTGTISLWFNINSYPAQDSEYAFITKSNYSDNVHFSLIGVLSNGGLVYFSKYANGPDDAGRVTGPGTVQIDTWYHFAIVADGVNTPVFYLNGQVVPTNILVHDSGNRFYDYGSTFQIGRFFRSQDNPGTHYLNGSLDDMQIYDSTLSADEIQHLYYQGFPDCHFVPGDVNGDCRANGIDIVYYVNYLKGGLPLIRRCDCQTDH